MTRILIIDDEPSAGNILRLLIEKYITVAKEVRVCSSPEEAIELIPEYQPSLLMLDIEMPCMDGFDLLNRMGNWNFDVVFTTAYDKYAIKAIRFSALDYLLKPVDIIELQNAINRHIIRRELQPQQKPGMLVNNLMDNLQQKSATSFKLALSTMEGFHFYETKDILRCEGDNNYTHFHFLKHKPLVVSRTLKEFEDILSGYGFIRIHKSHLVNIREVVRLDKEGSLWLSDGTCLVVSRRRREDVLKLLAVRQQ